MTVVIFPIGNSDRTTLSSLNDSYCKTIPFPCGSDRVDSQFFEYFNSRCYCDMFCYHYSQDCCPDFKEVCLLSSNNKTVVIHDGNDHVKSSSGYIVNDDDVDYENADGDDEKEQRSARTNLQINDPYFIREINSQRRGWDARIYKNWPNTSVQYLIDRLLGSTNILNGIERISIYEHDPHDVEQFRPKIRWDPRNRFDDVWQIVPIRDQHRCPLSWIISAVDVTADRFARMSYISNIWNYTTNGLSIMHMLSCSSSKYIKDRNCMYLNGSVEKAWKFLYYLGTVTELCYPSEIGTNDFQIDKCKLYMNKRTKHRIHLGAQFVKLICPTSINSPKPTLFFRIGKPYRLQPGSDIDIQYEIYLRGSVQATMLVCPDFIHYKSGIYQRLYDGDMDLCRYHSVRIIGWGHVYDRKRNPRLYWICANSWGTHWGENGFFKIFSNDSEINKWVVTTFGHEEFYSH
ncbi:hypothetical protein GJ496_011608 [Pomphorhynchus laevis]|nr:hypothetical protein GJ496_011608 [Pomphorhynchus laevis]